ncbi:MAG: hypothetical protein OXC93_07755 [Rhodospirillaceae bacterium]|nr:hypothetical protein [Rhodospirillaceae bacterium]
MKVVHDEPSAHAHDGPDLTKILPSLKESLRLVVIYNGDKSQPGSVIQETTNPRASKSYRPVAEDIADCLEKAGFRHVTLLPDDISLPAQIIRHDLQFAWINSAGIQGYDSAGHTSSMLEMMGIPYVGHSPAAALILDNKHLFKQAATGLGIATAPFTIWNPVTHGSAHRDAVFWERAFNAYQGPFIVKPVSGRASLHVHFIDDRSGLAQVVEKVYADTHNTVLIETFLSGREFTIAVAGPTRYRKGVVDRLDQPFVISVAERILTHGERIFTSMDISPITTKRASILDPAAEPDIYDELVRIGRNVFMQHQLGALIRVDVRADVTGRLCVLEVNPKPDLTRPRKDKTPLVAMGLPALDMSYEDLLLSLLLDRLQFYCDHRPGAIRHIADLAMLLET